MHEYGGISVLLTVNADEVRRDFMRVQRGGDIYLLNIIRHAEYIWVYSAGKELPLPVKRRLLIVGEVDAADINPLTRVGKRPRGRNEQEQKKDRQRGFNSLFHNPSKRTIFFLYRISRRALSVRGCLRKRT